MMPFYKDHPSLGQLAWFEKDGLPLNVPSLCGLLPKTGVGHQSGWLKGTFLTPLSVFYATRKRKLLTTFSLVVCLLDNFGSIFCKG
jgi:hypothetical protein